MKLLKTRVDFKPGTIIHSRSFLMAESTIDDRPYIFRERLSEVISREWLTDDEVRVTFPTILVKLVSPFMAFQANWF
jgi:hypothetical protein